MNYSNQYSHLLKFFEEGLLSIGSMDLTRVLDNLLFQWPWNPTGIDWIAVGSFGVANLDDLNSDSEMIEFIQSSGFGDCLFAAALISPEKPPIFGDPAFLFSHLDEVCWPDPGPKYVFGCSEEGAILVPSPKIIVEYNGTDCVRYAEI